MSKRRRIVAEDWRPKVGERVRLVGRDEDGNEIACAALVRWAGEQSAIVDFNGRTGEAAGTELRPR